MYLGINYNGMHDSSVCLTDAAGAVVYAVSEERFSRVKQDGRFPHRALAGVNLGEVSAIGIPYLPEAGPAIPSDDIFRSVMHPLSGYEVDVFPAIWRERLDALGRPLLFFDHHDMHAYSAFVMSGYEEALVLTCDNGAYSCPVTAAVFHVRNGEVRRLAAAAYGELETLASLYSDTTALLGFAPCKHEGKITGLASFGTSRADCRRDLWELHRQMRAGANRAYRWIGFLDEEVAPFYEPNLYQIAQLRRELPYNDADIARAAQDLLEEKVLVVARWVEQTCGHDIPMLLSGGVFANVKLNMEIARLGFSALFVCPPMGDEGLAIGAARGAFDAEDRASGVPNPRARRAAPVRDSVALGPRPCDDAASVVEAAGLVYRRLTQRQAAHRIAESLAAGMVVGVARGPQEFGPRALGLRSVLAGAGDPSLNGRLNDKLRRTDFMPFAPMLRAERFSDVFDLSALSADVSDCVPFMTICLPVHSWVADACPVVVHVDGTARPQVVRERDDPFLHALLAEYERLSGLPLVVNTSFNTHDEPMVSSADDAIAAFLAAELDLLLIEDCLVELNENQTALRLARIVRRQDGGVLKARHTALNRSFGRQVFEGAGRFNEFANDATDRPSPADEVAPLTRVRTVPGAGARPAQYQLTAAELERYREHGWVLLDNFVADDLNAIVDDLYGIFPTPRDYWSDPSRFTDLQGGQFDSVRTIPTGVRRLDRIPFDQRIQDIVTQVTQSTDLRLMRGGYQAKFADAAPFDQILHLDYTNHSLVVMPDELSSTMVGFFIYFDDVTVENGPTMVVSRTKTRRMHITDTHLDRESWPLVYDAEEHVPCRAGSMLVYDYRTFHRGSSLTGSKASRLSLSFAYGQAAPWHGFYSWPNRADEPEIAQLIASLAPADRELLGFPPIGNRFWTPRTIEAVCRRYPGFDDAPYRAALSADDEST
jgi:carbamoyltransferase